MSTDTEPTVQSKSVNAAEKRSFRIPGHWIAIGTFVVIFAVFAGFTLAFRRGAGSEYTVPTRISKEEMTMIVKDLNPMQQRQLSENPEQKQLLAKELSRLLSIAKQAERDGVTSEKAVKSELRFIEAAIIANNFDQKTSGNQQPQTAQAGAFASVTEEEIKNYWAAKDVTPGLLDNIGFEADSAASREKGFQDFIDAKISIAKASGQMAEDQKPSDEELNMAKGIFAKTQITFQKALDKFESAKTLPVEERKDWFKFEKSVRLQVKLQRAQFLTQYYGQNVLSKKLEVTDDDVEKYLKENPELGDASKKKESAEEIINKLEAGGDFAALAKEYSEDPGSKNNGGLYENVKMKQMDPVFEKAALSLEPGSFTKTPVETNFGYHIIQLVSKNDTKDEAGNPALEYNVRHILISTQISDPSNPMARPVGPKEFAKTKLQTEREKAILDEIEAKNPVSVATDFELPKVSAEDIQKQLQQQQRGLAPPPPPRAPEPRVEQK